MPQLFDACAAGLGPATSGFGRQLQHASPRAHAIGTRASQATCAACHTQCCCKTSWGLSSCCSPPRSSRSSSRTRRARAGATSEPRRIWIPNHLMPRANTRPLGPTGPLRRLRMIVVPGSGTCLLVACYMLAMCLPYACHMLAICLRYACDMVAIWLRYGCDMLAICLPYDCHMIAI